MFYGISMSIVPVVGYHLGTRNRKELHSLRRGGLILTGGFGVVTAALSFLLPLIMGGDGIWLSLTTAEVLALLTALGCFIWWNRTEEKHINGALPEE